MTEATPTPSSAPSFTGAQSSERDELRAKIEASERRIAERTLADQAREAAGAATEYTRQNPLTVLGGAIVVGLAIGLMTSPGRRTAASAATGTAKAVSGAATGAVSGVGNAAKKQGSAFGTMIADGLVAYGMKLIDDALDAGRASQDAIEDVSDSATAKARELRREAGYAAGTAIDQGRSMTQRTRRKAERAVRDLKDRVTS